MMSLDDFLDEAFLADVISVDTEANGQDIRDGRGFAIGVSVAFRDLTGNIQSAYFPFRHRFGDNIDKSYIAKLKMLFNAPDIILVFHNAKFDLVSLATLGISVPDRFYDTMLMAHMVNENWVSKALDWLGLALLKKGKSGQDKVKAFADAEGGWDGVPVSIMSKYARIDAERTLELYEYLCPEFHKQGLDSLWPIERAFIRLLIVMEGRGIRVDTGLCKTNAERGRMFMENITLGLGLNPGSPKQLQQLLFDELGIEPNKEFLTPKGKPSLNKQAMAYYEEVLEDMESDIADNIKTYRGWQKACAVAYEGYPALLSPDGRLRPNYKMHGTVTGRLSCEQPNLQQIPKVSDKQWDGALKSCFIAADGYELWEADYSQLELRLGAAYANERSLISEFSKPDSDVFTRMAEELGFTRDRTKTLVYTLQYGGGLKRLSYVFKVNSTRAAEIRDNYFNTYPGFKKISNAAQTKARRTKQIKMWTGRIRHFEDPESEAHKALNAVIQGGAAEIVKRTMLRLREGVDDGETCRMLLQVHDSVVFEIRKDCVAETLPRIKQIMEAVEPDFGVHFAVDIKRWGEK
jgi:DNA polymerase-1